MQGLGEYNELEILRNTPHGLFLKFDEIDILLPKKFATDEMEVGSKIRVFVYTDSEDRLVATTQIPKGIVGDFVALEVKDTTAYGAFLDWGLDKDLFVPLKEQGSKMQPSEVHVVRVCIDYRTNRIIGVAKLSAFLADADEEIQEEEEVEAIIIGKSPLGYKAIVNNEYNGLLFGNEVFKPLKVGEELTCYIKKIRPDGKIDLRLKKAGLDAIIGDAQVVWDALNENNGKLELTDKSAPEEISEALGLSKKAFKKALGTLYREDKIDLADNCISIRE